MTFVAINPRYRDLFTDAGLASASDFLACAGEPICVREDRRVERVAIAGLDAYLKKETRILLRERLSSWWTGYGWTSKSVREGIVLGELAAAQVACPTVLALGEEDGQAFVLLKAEHGVESLDVFLRRRPDQARRIASLLGRELARMHESGFHHPDLFAKHILVGQQGGLDRVCLIDWQRTRHLRKITWARRAFDLAALDASLAEEAVPPRVRLRLLASYLHSSNSPRPRLSRFIDAIRGRVWWLLRQRRIRRLRRASLPAIEIRATANLGVAGPHNRNDWQTLPLQLTDPNLAVLPLVEILGTRTDVEWRRRRKTLREAGRTLRSVHCAGYRPDADLESWATRETGTGDVEVVLTRVSDLTPTLTPDAALSADDLARLFLRHGSRLSRGEWSAVLHGYVGPTASPADSSAARRDLVRRVVSRIRTLPNADARETVR